MGQFERPAVAVIGDVGGHLGPLVTALSALGVDVVNARVPDGLTVVQVGDLVHRGPDSQGVVELVDRFLRRDPQRWVQLVGNHEMQLLPRGTQFFAEADTDAEVGDAVRRWWSEGLLQVGFAFECAGVPASPRKRSRKCVATGSVLVTHAGLSRGAWRLLGSPPDGKAVVSKLNAPHRDLPAVVWREGLVTTGIYDSLAGPLWAAPAESVGSWVEAGISPPFSQVFGHAQLYRWDSTAANKWDPGVASFRNSRAVSSSVDKRSRHTRIVFDSDTAVWAVDPGHGRLPAATWAPLVLPRR